jgi:hypothetical protein
MKNTVYANILLLNKLIELYGEDTLLDALEEE